MNTPAHTSPQSNPRVYVLHPFPPVAPRAPPAPQPALPAPQPLPQPVLHPGRPTLKLGLDVHLEFIMAVAQRDHASPLAPRKTTDGSDARRAEKRGRRERTRARTPRSRRKKRRHGASKRRRGSGKRAGPGGAEPGRARRTAAHEVKRTETRAADGQSKRQEEPKAPRTFDGRVQHRMERTLRPLTSSLNTRSPGALRSFPSFGGCARAS